jgi:hypothetical protein
VSIRWELAAMQEIKNCANARLDKLSHAGTPPRANLVYPQAWVAVHG